MDKSRLIQNMFRKSSVMHGEVANLVSRVGDCDVEDCVKGIFITYEN